MTQQVVAQDSVRVSEREVMSLMQNEADDFFTQIMGTDMQTVLITDETALSDFTFCGGPADLAPPMATYEECCDAWDYWVLSRIAEVYDIEVQSTDALLVDVLQQIEMRKHRILH